MFSYQPNPIRPTVPRVTPRTIGVRSNTTIAAIQAILAAVTANAGPVVIDVIGDLTIPAGVTLTPANPCKGLYLRVFGDLDVSGTISMSAKGSTGAGVSTPLTPPAIFTMNPPSGATEAETLARAREFFKVLTGRVTATIPAAGASGGVDLGGGGGGAGSPSGGGKGGNGGTGTSFIGGGGGGGGSSTGAGGDGTGGAGGSSVAGGKGGGGAGNPPGSGAGGGAAGGASAGAIIAIQVFGSVAISGAIYSDGAAGGIGGSGGGGGGGSGGGSIVIEHGGTYANAGTLRANGGIGGDSGTTLGGSGGAGSIIVTKRGDWV